MVTAKNILENQLDIEVKKKKANIVIDNFSDLKSLTTQIQDLYQRIFHITTD